MKRLRNIGMSVASVVCVGFPNVLIQKSHTQSDIAMVNGGGIRTDLKQGDVTINDLFTIMPFGNKIYKASITGELLLDVLEYAVSFLPNEEGVFMQVSGLRFAVNSTLPTPVVVDKEKDVFSHVGPGERRVSGVQIWDESEKKLLVPFFVKSK